MGCQAMLILLIHWDLGSISFKELTEWPPLVCNFPYIAMLLTTVPLISITFSQVSQRCCGRIMLLKTEDINSTFDHF